MKYIISFFLATIVIPCFSQVNHVPNAVGLDIATKKYLSSGVVQVDSKPARILTEAAYKWLSEVKYVETLGSKGINTEEAAFNRLIVSQYFFGTYNTKIRFIIYLEFRDGRYKYTFTDWSFLETTARTDFEMAAQPGNIAKMPKFLKDANNYIAQWITEFTAYLNAYQPDESW